MLNLTTSTAAIESPGAYAYGVPGSYRHKTALYGQVMNNISLKPGQVLLELSLSDDSILKVMASINTVQPDPMGGFPGLFELSSAETGIGRSFSANSIPLTDNSFDLIICIGIFNIITDHTGTITEIHRLLSPNGKLIIADQWFRRPGPMFANLLNQYNQHSESRIYTPTWVTRLLKKNGFGLVDIYAAGATNFLCNASAVK